MMMLHFCWIYICGFQFKSCQLLWVAFVCGVCICVYVRMVCNGRRREKIKSTPNPVVALRSSTYLANSSPSHRAQLATAWRATTGRYFTMYSYKIGVVGVGVAVIAGACATVPLPHLLFVCTTWESQKEVVSLNRSGGRPKFWPRLMTTDLLQYDVAVSETHHTTCSKHVVVDGKGPASMQPSHVHFWMCMKHRF